MPRADTMLSPRLRAWLAILLLGEVLVTLYLVAGTHGMIVPLDHPSSTDFVSFYAAGKLAASGTAALAYDPVAHGAAEWAATEPGVQYQFFFYPPVFLLLAAPLSMLPYLLAFAVFEAATLALLLVAIRPIVSLRGAVWLLPVLAFPAVFWTLGLGQNAFLSAALFASGTRLIDRRPWLAGLLLGALVYKPHLGILIPLALIAGRHWRAVAGAAASSAGLTALSIAVFGWQAWAAFFGTFLAAHGTFENGRIELAGMISVFAAARQLGVPIAYAYGLQAVAAAAAAAAVAAVWWRRASLPLRAASLIAGTLVALPVLLLYDLMLLGVAGAWLLLEIRSDGARTGERILLGAAFVTPLVCRSIGLASHIGVAPLVTALLLAMCVARAVSLRNNNVVRT